MISVLWNAELHAHPKRTRVSPDDAPIELVKSRPSQTVSHRSLRDDGETVSGTHNVSPGAVARRGLRDTGSLTRSLGIRNNEIERLVGRCPKATGNVKRCGQLVKLGRESAGIARGRRSTHRHLINPYNETGERFRAGPGHCRLGPTRHRERAASEPNIEFGRVDLRVCSELREHGGFDAGLSSVNARRGSKYLNDIGAASLSGPFGGINGRPVLLRRTSG
ncbi:MAG: hypothetical protein ACJAYU_003449 [Bradymonadia bacterium]|jgi:hypothetical protein